MFMLPLHILFDFLFKSQSYVRLQNRLYTSEHRHFFKKMQLSYAACTDKISVIIEKVSFLKQTAFPISKFHKVFHSLMKELLY